VGIFNKAKEKNIAPGNFWEIPGKHLGKVHLLIFSIKGVLDKKKFSSKSSNAIGIWWQLCKSMVQSGGTGTFLNFLDESQEMRNRLAFFSVLWLIYWILGGRKWYRIQENTDSLLINCGNVRNYPAKCQQLQLNTAYQWNKDATWNHINSADSNSTTKVTIISMAPGF